MSIRTVHLVVVSDDGNLWLTSFSSFDKSVAHNEAVNLLKAGRKYVTVLSVDHFGVVK